MKRLLILAALFLQAGAQPINIAVKNPSFEDPITANGSQAGNYEQSNGCGNFFYPNVPGWVSGQTSWAGAGVWNVIDPTQCTFSPPPDGKSVLQLEFFANNPTGATSATISQDLGSVYDLVPHTEGIFRLTFSVADKYYLKGWYPGNYKVSLDLKDIPNSPVPIYPQNLCQTSGIANGDFIAITLMCPSPPRYGELILTLSSFGAWGVVFDNVSLTFTPSN